MNNSKNDKTNKEKLLKSALESGKRGEINSEDDVKGFINKNLSEEDARKITEILDDGEKRKALLNSDIAKELYKKLFGGEKNG